MLPGVRRRSQGLTTDEVAEPVIEALRERGLLVEAGTIVHRYPICWRCKTPLVFRVVDDWFISARRDPAADARRERDRRVDAAAVRQADGRLAAQHGRLEHLAQALLRAAAAVLSLRVRAPERDRLARRARGARRLGARRSCRSCTGRGSTRCAIRCEQCGGEVERIAEVGDAWLDAGIVHFSTLGWQNPSGSSTATRPARRAGLTGADLPDHAYWEKWFPADWVSRDARADPALVLLAVLHGGDARRRARRTGGCSPTRRCSTRTAARCTSRGATRSS